MQAHIIWSVDDTNHWHEVTERTCALVTGFTLEHFYTGEAAISAFAHVYGTEAQPHIILMDFYLGSTRGDIVTQSLRGLESHGGRHSIIIGHSTAQHGSRAICQAGGDIMVRKHDNEQAFNSSLLGWLQSYQREFMSG